MIQPLGEHDSHNGQTDLKSVRSPDRRRSDHRKSPAVNFLGGGSAPILRLEARRAAGQDSVGHGWTSSPSGKVVVVVGAAAAAAPAWVRPVRSGVVFPLPKMRLQTVPTAAAISA